MNITGGGEASKIEKERLGLDTSRLTIEKAAYKPLALQNFSGLFLISGLVSSLMLLISMAKLAYARWTGAEDTDDAVQTAGTNPGDEQYRPLEDTTDNISVLVDDHPRPESTNGANQGGHGSGGSVGHRLRLNEVDDRSVPEESLTDEAMISHERSHNNSSASAGYEECGASASAVHDGSLCLHKHNP